MKNSNDTTSQDELYKRLTNAIFYINSIKD